MKKRKSIIAIIVAVVIILMGGFFLFGNNDPKVASISNDGSQVEDVSSYEEVVLVENEDCVFSFKTIERNEVNGTYDINLYLENKSDDLQFYSVESLSINGYVLDVPWGTELNAGMKENTAIYIYDDYIKDAGVPMPMKDIVLEVWIAEAEEIDESQFDIGDTIVKETFTINLTE